jgi:hypothetical protein
MSIGIQLTRFDDWYEYLKQMPEEMQDRMREKMNMLVVKLQEKVLDNLHGKVLNKVSGQLADSISKQVRVDSRAISAWVGPIPMTPKAYALELGGTSYYKIVPTKKDFLKFEGKDGNLVIRKIVRHPPSKAFGYLIKALEEMGPDIDQAFTELLDEATQ